MYKLVIIWDFDGDKEEQYYPTLEQAEQAEHDMHKAFGKQIRWTGIVKERS